MENELKDNRPAKTPMRTLVFDLRWHEALQELSSYEREEIYDAIFQYAKDGKELECSGSMKRMVLRMIYDQIDDQRKTLEELREM